MPYFANATFTAGNILCIQLLAAILLVSYGQTLVSRSQSLFLVDRVVCRKKGLAMQDQADLSSVQNVIVFS